jgi:glucosamine-6-phosphate deaminase
MPLKVVVASDFDHVSEVAAAFVIEDMRQKLASAPAYVLGLAAGNSPTGLYKHLAKAANAGRIDSSKIAGFALDEYIGLPGENAQQRALHKASYSFFLIQEFFGLLQKRFREINVPWSTLIDQALLESELNTNPEDWELQGCDRGKAVIIRQDARSEYLRWIRREILDGYANKIARCGGIDLHIIGVGGRGHVGFHEAGIPFPNNQVILIKLDDNTISNAVADGHFSSTEDCPLYAISMGAELVYRAKTVLLLAIGERKANVVADALLMAPDCSVPISYSHVLSQKGGNMIFAIDRLAAAKVLEKADQLRQRGIELEDLSSQKASISVANLQFSRSPVTGLLC